MIDWVKKNTTNTSHEGYTDTGYLHRVGSWQLRAAGGKKGRHLPVTTACSEEGR